MHGLIFETSIWLLAGSTRFLNRKQTRKFVLLDVTDIILLQLFIFCAETHENAEFNDHTGNTTLKHLPWYQNWFTVIASQVDVVLQISLCNTPHWCENLNSSDVQIQILKHIAKVKYLSQFKFWFARLFVSACARRAPTGGAQSKPKARNNYSIAKTYTDHMPTDA